MDEMDKRIINRIQSDFPVTSRPFLEVGREVHLTEAEVIDRIARLKREGVIRRIGGNFHSSRLDFASTLCAAKVPPQRIDVFVDAVNRYPGVTHNYLRRDDYNVWFTFIARDMAEIEEALDAVARETGVSDILNLPAVRTFKIKVDFEV